MTEDEARVERVAQAICDAEHNAGAYDANEWMRHMYKQIAIAAIAAATAWQPIETVPKDHKIMVLGTWAGEINGIDDEGPSIYIVKFSGRSDYSGFDWACQDTDAYAVWVKATHWMPLPEPPR